MAALAPGWSWVGILLGLLVGVGLLGLGRPVLALVALSTLGSVGFASAPSVPLPPGPTTQTGVVASEPYQGHSRSWMLLRTGEGQVRVGFEWSGDVERGDRVLVSGISDGEPGEMRGQPHRGTINAASVEILERAGGVAGLGNAMRRRVIERLSPVSRGRGLLAGFLIGDLEGVDGIDREAMRRAGLSHFTAVSGSNVALYLVLLYLATLPLSLGPRMRAGIGLAGLPVYAVATGLEPSVMRASAMAGIVLIGRLFGFGLETWQVMSAAIVGLIVVDPSIVSNVGFQLSVAATAGVVVGMRWPVDGGKIVRALTVTLCAQLAVAPLLLVYFGSIPLVSPLANLVAAPVVSAATVTGSLGAVGVPFMVEIGATLASAVLAIAHSVAVLPQIDVIGFACVIAAAWLSLRFQSLRPLMAVALAVGIVLAVALPPPVPGNSVVVLDVGQGDAMLLFGDDGSVGLVDGGPDPVVLEQKLIEYGVGPIDLLVATHIHSDHVGGLVGVVERRRFDHAVLAFEPHDSAAASALLDVLGATGVTVSSPRVGQTFDLGSLKLRVIGPQRRYASPNDQSVVLLVEGPGRTMLLSGDIEVVAQGELKGVKADVLKVPHQGAATSDPEWLVSVGATEAVISVGPNEYGHPAQWVVELLEESGALVRRTDLEGNILIPLG